MADLDDIKDGKDFGAGTPPDTSRFFLKGAAHHDWGMKARLSAMFRPETGRTVMLAFDHGYFQGPTTGLERIDLTIAPLAPYTDVLMGTRGAIRTMIPPEVNKPVALRCSAGNSILTELSNELISVEIEDALRLGVSAMAAQVYIGAEYEHKSIGNVVKLIDSGLRYGIPTMAVTGVGADMVRDARYFGLATRIAAEIGAQVVKSYYVDEGFENIVLGCPVPIVIAGGKKLPEADALEMAYRAIDQGAAGVDMGRNVFQSEKPLAMLKALEAVVHHGATGAEAYQLFQDS
ncbi:autoinducer 2 aldolase [Actibacterium mucosum KCTC 23349]|uniref:Autoinducer 2 aldolase n=1 Tax=Actibacterium mucosum KCTC 23349 TaxID=1454373 RepID=A0A037ZI12_9RHOB|nr:3-hydroxy-5-phosphonooxypentane-2,4-dione thiolase [Actibacterium mucosum]KAJ56090.1 autoinducer 2 aldolase [Actibacterium mucosum KCTC 23349]